MSSDDLLHVGIVVDGFELHQPNRSVQTLTAPSWSAIDRDSSS